MDQPTVGMSTNLDSASNLTSFGLPQGLIKAREPVDTIALQNVRAEVRTSKVMIIDDEELVIRVVRRFLASDGYENFVTLTDPRKAIEGNDPLQGPRRRHRVSGRSQGQGDRRRR